MLLTAFLSSLFFFPRFFPPMIADACDACRRMWHEESLPQGTNSGIMFEQYQNIQINSKILDFNFVSPRLTNIKAAYTISNTTNETLTIKTRFLAPFYRFRENNRIYNITANNIPLNYTTEFLPSDDFISLYDWRDSSNWVDNYSNQLKVISFEAVFAPNQTLDLVVQYSFLLHSNFNASSRKRLKYSFSPFRYWADNGSMVININMYEGHLFNASLDFERVSARLYRFESNSLPNENLLATLSSMQRGFAFLSNGSVFLFFFAIFLLLMIAAVLAFGFIVLIKRYQRGRILSKMNLGYWIAFLLCGAAMAVFCVLILIGWVVIHGWPFFFGVVAFLLSAPTIALFITALLTIKSQPKNKRE